jgi:hypothetical protein
MFRFGIVAFVYIGLVGCAPAPKPVTQSSSAESDAAAVIAHLQATDPGALQTVALFEHGCFPYIGDADRLRVQAALLGAQPAPAAMVPQFLHGHAGMVFNASSPAGKRVLISFDNGMCGVTAPTDDGEAIEVVILHDIIHIGGVPKQVFVKKNGDQGTKVVSFTFFLHGAYPIVTFMSFTPPAGSTVPKQISIAGGNLSLDLTH